MVRTKSGRLSVRASGSTDFVALERTRARGPGLGPAASRLRKTGVDPARSMLDRAEERGVEVIQGVAEALPLECSSFDYTRLRGP